MDYNHIPPLSASSPLSASNQHQQVGTKTCSSMALKDKDLPRLSPSLIIKTMIIKQQDVASIFRIQVVLTLPTSLWCTLGDKTKQTVTFSGIIKGKGRMSIYHQLMAKD